MNKENKSCYHKQFEPVAIYGKHEHEQAFFHFIIVMSISMPTSAPISSSSLWQACTGLITVTH
jgi:hypothetical protein